MFLLILIVPFLCSLELVNQNLEYADYISLLKSKGQRFISMKLEWAGPIQEALKH